MKEESDGLEKFFNSHLQDEREIPFEEADWKHMEQKLDEFDAMAGAGGLSKRLILLIMVGAVIVFLGGWFSRGYFTGGQQEISATLPTVSDITRESDIFSGKESLEDSANRSQESNVSEPHDGNEQLNDLKTQNEFHPNTTEEFFMRSFPEDRSVTYRVLSDNSMPEKLTRKFPRYDFLLPGIIPKGYSSDTIFMKSISTENQKIDRSGEGWSVGAVVAPDLNGVGSSENYKLAWEAGTMVYYSPHANWRFSTGILYAKKAYQAGGTDYHPPEGYWDNATNGYIPERIDARCAILDIPLNITYRWNPRAGVRFTTTTGISTYVLLNENYEYDFGYYNPAGGYNTWSTSGNSAAVFGMWNAGVGVEYSVRTGLDLSIEPYIKVPLKEVGFGNVSLNGAGVFLTIRKQLTNKQR